MKRFDCFGIHIAEYRPFKQWRKVDLVRELGDAYEKRYGDIASRYPLKVLKEVCLRRYCQSNEYFVRYDLKGLEQLVSELNACDLKFRGEKAIRIVLLP